MIKKDSTSVCLIFTPKISKKDIYKRQNEMIAFLSAIQWRYEVLVGETEHMAIFAQKLLVERK